MTEKLIPKAFVITKDEISNKHLHKKIALNNQYSLYFSEDMRMYEFNSSEGKAILLGYAFDNTQPLLNEVEILENVVSERLSATSHNINHLNGSFVIVKVSPNDDIEIFSDAAGFRSPYYTGDLQIISSHDKLIGDIFGNKKIYSSTKTLDYSRYENVYKLVPSVKLTIAQGKARIFPNPESPQYTYEEILEKLKDNVNHLNVALDNVKNKLLVSITGGIDSKCTLAMTKPLTKKVKTFTYIKEIEAITNARAKNIYKTDKLIVERLVKNLNLDHELIEFKVDQAEDSFSKNMYEVTGTVFNHPIAEIFERKYKDEPEDILQFRSVIYSNAKFDYPKAFYKATLNVEDLYDYMQHKQLKMKSDEESRKIIDNYIARTVTEIYPDDIIKTLDVIHIDSRMGNWHSQLVKETDRVMDYFNYINDRSALNLLLQLPYEIRKYHLLHKDLIDDYWPILNFFEGNANSNLYKLERSQLMESIAHDAGINDIIHFNFEFNDATIAMIPKVKLKDTQSIRYRLTIEEATDSKLYSTYSKEAGRNYISVIIANDNQKEVLDIVDLSKGYHLNANELYEIEIKYHKPTTTNSWVKAGTLYLEKY